MVYHVEEQKITCAIYIVLLAIVLGWHAEGRDRFRSAHNWFRLTFIYTSVTVHSRLISYTFASLATGWEKYRGEVSITGANPF